MPRPRCVQLCVFAPPVTGQTVSAELTSRVLARSFEVQRVDISPGTLRSSPPVRALRNARTLGTYRRLRAELSERPADLLFVVPSSSTLGRVRDALGTHALRPHVGRIVARIHSGDFHRGFQAGLAAGLMRRMVEEVDLFVFLSEGLSAACARWIPARKRCVVANWLDAEMELSDDEVAAKLAAPPEESLRVAFVSNMLVAKGYRELAAALARCRQQGLRMEADFMGGFDRPGNRPAFERRLRQLGLADVARIHGAVADPRKIRDLLARAHVLVLPSRHSVEAQPRVILEAMATATPIVATPRGAIPEMLLDGVNGYHLASTSPQEIARVLPKLTDPECWRARAAASRRIYRERFDAAKQVEALLEAVRGKGAEER